MVGDISGFELTVNDGMAVHQVVHGESKLTDVDFIHIRMFTSIAVATCQ